MKVLLVSDVPPCNNFAGGIVLRNLSNFLINRGHKLSCFIVADPLLDFDIPENIFNKINYYRIDRPLESWGQKRMGSWLSIIMNNYNSLFEIPKIAKKCVEFIQKNKVEQIWFVIQGQTTIRLVRRISNVVKLPFCVQIWDPPEWWLNDKKFDKFTSKLVMNEFGRALHEANSCITPSSEMADEYHKKYDANCVSLLPGSKLTKVMKRKKENKNEFVIAVIGQIYATEEFQSLLKALSIKGWRYHKKKIVLRLYGRFFTDFSFKNSVNIEIRGWLHQKDLLKELADVDLLYCPYFFADSYSYISRLSFPSKLSTYLSMNVPVLFHGPKYSSPYIFLKKYKASYFCETMDSKIIADCVVNIIKDTSVNKKRILLNAKRAFSENLTFKLMEEKFFNALNIKNEKF